MDGSDGSRQDAPDADAVETTASLLARCRDGEAAARERLLQRYLLVLRRWAHGRLPRHARDLSDTDDLVQVTLLKALEHVKEFTPRREGAFLAYLRRTMMNQIRDELRRARRRPGREALPDDLAGQEPSPLEQVMGEEQLAAYEAALTRLTESQQEAVVLRLELGFSHREVAEALELASPNAARMLVARALVRLAEEMDGQG